MKNTVESNGTILVAEDERTARSALAELLEGRGYRVIQAEDGPEALSALMQRASGFDACLLDIRMPGLDGLAILKRAREAGIEVPVIVMTAHGDSGTVIEAMRLGAYDYIAKPVDFESLACQLERAIARRRMFRDIGRESSPRNGSAEPAIVGYSPAMQHVYKLVGQVAGSEATVLVRGESGTGKELVVNAIHHNSMRSKGPLVKVNCAAIPESLLESELFGHEKGAFTNAMLRRIGRFEEANGGTLFLDEIGELATAPQSKLLRAIQERTIERLGSGSPIRVDLRLVAATSRDLEKAVGEGQFREDLYYRLSVVVIDLPPLRDRHQDIPALVEHFLRRTGGSVSMAPAALNLLCEYQWPGNVRELENTVARAAVLAKGGIIDAQDIQLKPVSRNAENWTGQIPLAEGWKANLAAAEKAMVARALRIAGGNKSKAAGMLAIHRRLLYEKMREYGIGENPE
jgi:two-component system, NtrC family, response regulator AtoC